MFEYFAYYDRKKIVVKAETSYKAEVEAAKVFKVKPNKSYKIAIVKCDQYDNYIRTL